jgi:hypothetical protein
MCFGEMREAYKILEREFEGGDYKDDLVLGG